MKIPFYLNAKRFNDIHSLEAWLATHSRTVFHCITVNRYLIMYAERVYYYDNDLN